MRSTPKIIATPPKYGTGSLWVLCAELGASNIFLFIAILLITGVRKPTSAKVDANSRKY